MKQTIIFGNIITMDEKRPFAKAAVVKNGVSEEARRCRRKGNGLW